jgi:hypothetical protein
MILVVSLYTPMFFLRCETILLTSNGGAVLEPIEPFLRADEVLDPTSDLGRVSQVLEGGGPRVGS